MFVGTAIAVAGAAYSGYQSNKQNKIAEGAANTQSQLAESQAALAEEQWQRYKDTYAPLELAMVDEASQFDNEAKTAAAAAAANANVQTEFGKARERLLRTPGLDASSPAFASRMADLELAQAGAAAAAQNQARTQQADKAWARKTAVLGMGKGLDTTAAAGLGAAAATQGNIANNATQQATHYGQAAGATLNQAVSSKAWEQVANSNFWQGLSNIASNNVSWG